MCGTWSSLKLAFSQRLPVSFRGANVGGRVKGVCKCKMEITIIQRSKQRESNVQHTCVHPHHQVFEKMFCQGVVVIGNSVKSLIKCQIEEVKKEDVFLKRGVDAIYLGSRFFQQIAIGNANKPILHSSFVIQNATRMFESTQYQR